MSLKSRLLRIEKNSGYGISFQTLTCEDFRYKGRPFNSVEEIINHFKIQDAPDNISHTDVGWLYHNNVLSPDSEEVKRMYEAVKEMTEAM